MSSLKRLHQIAEEIGVILRANGHDRVKFAFCDELGHCGIAINVDGQRTAVKIRLDALDDANIADDAAKVFLRFLSRGKDDGADALRDD